MVCSDDNNAHRDNSWLNLRLVAPANCQKPSRVPVGCLYKLFCLVVDTESQFGRICCPPESAEEICQVSEAANSAGSNSVRVKYPKKDC